MKLTVLTAFIILIVLSGCRDDGMQDPIPDVYVNFTINRNNPSYSDLNPRGGYVYFENEGYRGIILIHTFGGEYIALERACTYDTSVNCAVVTMRSTGIELGCGQYVEKDESEDWEACCDSGFHTDGHVLHGPARYPLKRYQVMRDGDLITVSN